MAKGFAGFLLCVYVYAFALTGRGVRNLYGKLVWVLMGYCEVAKLDGCLGCGW
jgi:hypothetical protein